MKRIIRFIVRPIALLLYKKAYNKPMTTEETAKECVRLYNTGRYSREQLAKRYNVSTQTVKQWIWKDAYSYRPRVDK
jgi:DNA invertase Pin-like site-specific DNA recombinase